MNDERILGIVTRGNVSGQIHYLIPDIRLINDLEDRIARLEELLADTRAKLSPF